jgi:cell wall-associated NlpC family hydrolase
VHQLGRLLIVMLAIAAGACASSGSAGRAGSVPRPRPFPGAALPPEAVATAPAPVAPAPNAPIAPLAPAPDGPLAPLSALLRVALDLRGIPYRFGGSDPTGFDCSGFVQWVFNQVGLRLPREVRDQYDAGDKVDRDEIAPGDLVFFETVSRGASHVGLAIGGDQFVHAPSSTGVVRVERFTSSYWNSRYVGARRVAAKSAETD